MRQTAPMLRIDDIHYAINGIPLFTGASAYVPDGHKVGLVGRNGTGKSTLFRLIRGHLTLEAGSIDLRQGARIGVVEQEAPGGETSVLDTVLAADTERADLLAERSNDHARIAEIQTRLTDIDAWSAEARASAILRGLGLSQDQHDLACSTLSGGWRMRIALAATLFSRPDLLLLDEPTNYLDLEGAFWLYDYIAKYPHAAIIISHDRSLLNHSVDSVLHLERKTLTSYRGSYDRFVRQRAERAAHAAAVARKQEARRAHLQSYVDRFRYKADKARQAQSRLKMIARMEFVSSPEEAARAAFLFPDPERLAPPLIAVENASTGYDGTPVLRKLDLRIDQEDRIALLGRNGEGKSTLCRFLSGKLEPFRGSVVRARKLRVGYFAQHQIEDLDPDDTPLGHLVPRRPNAAPSALKSKLAGFGLAADRADTPVRKLSGGQKSRLSLLLATLDAPHLLILDEPTNHLDVESREALMDALASYSGAVIVISHDLHLLAMVADRLWLVKNGTVTNYEGDLDQYRGDLLAADRRETAPRTAKPAQAAGKRLQALRSELTRCESRVAKLMEMRERLIGKLANPALYEPGAAGNLNALQGKYGEVREAIDRAETLWLAAQEKLEAAESAAADRSGR